MGMLNPNIYKDLMRLRDELACKAFDGLAGNAVKDATLAEVVYKINSCLYRSKRCQNIEN